MALVLRKGISDRLFYSIIIIISQYINAVRETSEEQRR